MQTPTQIAHRARGLARQVTEDRIRAERTLETLRVKERQLCLEALQAEAVVINAPLTLLKQCAADVLKARIA